MLFLAIVAITVFSVIRVMNASGVNYDVVFSFGVYQWTELMKYSLAVSFEEFPWLFYIFIAISSIRALI